MSILDNLNYLSIAGALSFTSLIVLISLFVYMYHKSKSANDSYDRQLAELLSDDDAYDLEEMGIIPGKESAGDVKQPRISWLFKWNQYWANTMRGAGIGRYENDATTAGRDVAILLVIVGVAVGVVFKTPLLGLIVPLALGGGMAGVLRSRANKSEEELTKQLPGMLFAVKSNLQSGDTNERALMKVVDSMPDPLYSDLIIAKQILMSNGTFKESLQALSAHTSSRDLRFLCACMIQASKSGSSMAGQIDSIQEVLRSRQRVSHAISQAVKAVSPAIWVASFAIPGVFIASLLIDRASKEFWFVHPLSWLAFIAVLLLYAAGLFAAKKQVDKIKNM